MAFFSFGTCGAFSFTCPFHPFLIREQEQLMVTAGEAAMRAVRLASVSPAKDPSLWWTDTDGAQPRPCTGWTLSWHVLLASSKQTFRDFLRWQFHPNPCAPMDTPLTHLTTYWIYLDIWPPQNLSQYYYIFTNKSCLFLNLLPDHFIECSLLLVFQETVTNHSLFSMSSIIIISYMVHPDPACLFKLSIWSFGLFNFSSVPFYIFPGSPTSIL